MQRWRNLWIDTTGVLSLYPETDSFVALLHAYKPVNTAVDIGTGSGCIALAIKAERMADNVIATDIDPGACDRARFNAERNGVAIDVRCGDMYEPIHGEQVDMVVFNAPYAPTDACDTIPEPRIAVDGGADGMALIFRAIAECPSCVKRLAVGVGHGHYRAVRNLLEYVGFTVDTMARCPSHGVIRHMIGVRQ